VPAEEQVVIIWASGNGKLDDVPVGDVRRFETELQEYMRSHHGDLLEGIREDGKLDDDRIAELGSAVDAFKAQFRPSEVVEQAEHRTMEDLDTLRGEEEGADQQPGTE
jgi:F-type H+/Na+-transporting ATPase subunit alpha